MDEVGCISPSYDDTTAYKRYWDFTLTHRNRQHLLPKDTPTSLNPMASHIPRLQSSVVAYHWRGRQETLGEHNEGEWLECPRIWVDMEATEVGLSIAPGLTNPIYYSNTMEIKTCSQNQNREEVPFLETHCLFG